jgi:glycogen synthase
MKPTKILYVIGSSDIAKAYDEQITLRASQSFFGAAYDHQFLQVCEQLAIPAHLISILPTPANRATKFETPQITLEYRPVPNFYANGLLYHLGYMGYFIRLIYTLWQSQANVLLISYGSQYWWMLGWLPWFKIKIIPVFHNVLWPKFKPVKRSHRLLYRLTGRFLAHSCHEIHVTSQDIAQQIHQLTGENHPPIVNFLPVYPKQQFSHISPPNPKQRPFRVLFVGRIETNKGVYLVLELANRLISQGLSDIVFDICGDGDELPCLQQRIQEQGLGSIVNLHGFCDKNTLSQWYNRSHAVIVPTTQDFVEGFNMVVAEAVLAGRPVITSAVCPALNYVRPAAMEVAPDDVDGYYQAILRLAGDPALYRRKQQACATLQAPFYDLNNSWGAHLTQTLNRLQAKPPLPQARPLTTVP